MGRAARPLHDPGNHRAIERGSNLQAARRGGLIKPAKPAEERENTAALTPSLGARPGVAGLPPRSFSLDHWWEVPSRRRRVPAHARISASTQRGYRGRKRTGHRGSPADQEQAKTCCIVVSGSIAFAAKTTIVRSPLVR